MTDKEKLKAIRAEIHRLVDVRGYDKEMANDLFAFMDSLQNEPVSDSETVETQNKEVYMKPHSEPIYLGIGGIPIDAPKYLCKEEPVSEDLKEAANNYAVTVYNNYLDNPKAFENIDADTLNEDAFKAGAKWQKQQIKKSMDLGEPPYLISVEQAYYRTLKLLED